MKSSNKWTIDDNLKVVRMWNENEDILKIASELNVTIFALTKHIGRLKMKGFKLNDRNTGRKQIVK